ncbi:SDR family NAD(P)-dependent oxidoreductase [Micromonospora sp. NPDC049559]|uniref:SDR family NAD(P)-dependent oxidoreductase n=1 Tax=Micromonospora sp. NPDC049559 TaxID=3155923 RepID=UPI0034123171
MPPTPDRAVTPTPSGTDGPGQADIDACLRVLAEVGEADPDDPRWAPVRAALEQVHRASKRRRKLARRAERARHDRAVSAAATRYRDQDPRPVVGPDDLRAAGPDGPAPDQARPDQAGPGTSDSEASAGPVLLGERRCYVCKTRYRRVHADYHLLCPDCATENALRRHARCDLRGRRAVVTGGRIKIGFQVALKLLRDGAEVLVTTRFPRDAARRFAAVPDSADWLDRLHVHGVDFLDLAGVADLLAAIPERFAHLDILVNNAAQTIRRPAAYHREVRAAEREPLTGAAARVELVAGGGDLRIGAAAPDHGAARSGALALAGTAHPPAGLDALFPAGRVDETGQPLDLRDRNSWSLRLHEIEPAEWLEVQLVNAFAPFLLTSRLRGLLTASPFPDRYVVQVSAMEGSFSRRNKTVRHAHTNMAKASLNMLTRTVAADYARAGIHMTSVDTGWVTDERPHPEKLAQREAGFRPPLDVIDGAARVYDPIVRGIGGEPMSGVFLKDYRPVEW